LLYCPLFAPAYMYFSRKHIISNLILGSIFGDLVVFMRISFSFFHHDLWYCHLLTHVLVGIYNMVAATMMDIKNNVPVLQRLGTLKMTI